MPADLFRYAISPLEIMLRAVVIYAVLLVILRLFGKREVGQFTLYDLVLILLVANAVQPAITGPDTSLGGGILIILTLVLLNFVISRLDHRFGLFHRVFVGMPTQIIAHGKYLEAGMREEGLNKDEVESAIREHGLDGVEHVRLAYLEPDGSISIVPQDAGPFRLRRRIRYRRTRN